MWPGGDGAGCEVNGIMRLWTLHPKYLDAKGLVALWREALLAQEVLRGETRGYKHHPQLLRFAKMNNPPAALAAYLKAVHDEAVRRGYKFNTSKIRPATVPRKVKGDAWPVALRMAALETKVEKASSETASRSDGGKKSHVSPAVQDFARCGA